MTEKQLKSAAGATNERLPRRDWFLLPCAFFSTILLLGGGAEFVARLIYTQSPKGVEQCIVVNDATTGARGIPDSVCYEKSVETSTIEYRFNSCGHRAGMQCGPKPAGLYRIVMVGSSLPLAVHVQQRESFAALLPEVLSKKTGRKVDLYNEAMEWGYSHSVAMRFKDVLAARPDLILWILTPADVERSSLVLPTADDVGRWRSKSQAQRIWLRTLALLAGEPGRDAISDFIEHSRMAFVLQEFLYQSPTLYMKATLAGGDRDTGFLKDPMSTPWTDALKPFDRDAAAIEQQAIDARVPFAAVYVPNRVQTSMVSMGQWPTGIDPYKLSRELRPIIESHGGTYFDLLPEFRDIPDPERYYFPVDMHPNSEGHALLASLLAKQLTSGAVPGLTVNAQTRVNSDGDR